MTAVASLPRAFAARRYPLDHRTAPVCPALDPDAVGPPVRCAQQNTYIVPILPRRRRTPAPCPRFGPFPDRSRTTSRPLFP